MGCCERGDEPAGTQTVGKEELVTSLATVSFVSCFAALGVERCLNMCNYAAAASLAMPRN